MPRRKLRGRPLDGWLIIDKPPGLISTDVVNRVRRTFDAQKAGHGGTLDPLATVASSRVGGPLIALRVLRPRTSSIVSMPLGPSCAPAPP
jgi:hypothetical protein